MYAAHRSQRCRHVRANGMQCGSPALRGRPFCYFHYRMRRNRNFDYLLSGIEDASSLHLALMGMLRAVERNDYDPRTCSFMLRNLGLIAGNLKQYVLEQRADREEGEDFITELPEGEELEPEQEETGPQQQPADPHVVVNLLLQRLRSAGRAAMQTPGSTPQADGAPEVPVPSDSGEPHP